jgi:hypothetical protein
VRQALRKLPLGSGVEENADDVGAPLGIAISAGDRKAGEESGETCPGGPVGEWADLAGR